MDEAAEEEEAPEAAAEKPLIDAGVEEVRFSKEE